MLYGEKIFIYKMYSLWTYISKHFHSLVKIKPPCWNKLKQILKLLIFFSFFFCQNETMVFVLSTEAKRNDNDKLNKSLNYFYIYHTWW